MAKNKVARIAKIKKQAIWSIRLTLRQQQAFWEVFGDQISAKGNGQGAFFFLAKTRDLLVVEDLTGTKESRGRDHYRRGYIDFYFEHEAFKLVFTCGVHPFYSNKYMDKHPEIFANHKRWSKLVPFRNHRIQMNEAQWVKSILNLKHK